MPFAVLQKHWPNVPKWRDVCELTGEEVINTIGVPTLISAGFPCQDISVAGNGCGLSGSRSGLVFEALRLAEEIYPDYLLLENVPAIRTRGLWQILEKLAAIGYDAEWHTYSASRMGANQRRKRTFIIAYSPCKRISGSLAWDNISKAGSWGKGGTEDMFPILPRLERGCVPESVLCRSVDGIPHWMDRIKCLGNSIVPAQVYPILKAIADFERGC
jgi:DNA (cytosine-5)-methyltransferase 1